MNIALFLSLSSVRDRTRSPLPSVHINGSNSRTERTEQKREPGSGEGRATSELSQPCLPHMMHFAWEREREFAWKPRAPVTDASSCQCCYQWQCSVGCCCCCCCWSALLCKAGSRLRQLLGSRHRIPGNQRLILQASISTSGSRFTLTRVRETARHPVCLL